MKFLIQDLLDYSQIKAGKFRKNIKQFNIREALEDIMILFQRNAEIIGLEFMLDFINFSSRDYLISCDQERIQQVCLNLLSNAFKFTEKGFIKI